jgi:hypothetical protein
MLYCQKRVNGIHMHAAFPSASSEVTAAVAISNGGHGFIVEDDAAEAKQTSDARTVLFMTSRI